MPLSCLFDSNSWDFRVSLQQRCCGSWSDKKDTSVLCNVMICEATQVTQQG
jgi:hypothetical protein